jgi:hypothetical protein
MIVLGVHTPSGQPANWLLSDSVGKGRHIKNLYQWVGGCNRADKLFHPDNSEVSDDDTV